MTTYLIKNKITSSLKNWGGQIFVWGGHTQFDWAHASSTNASVYFNLTTPTPTALFLIAYINGFPVTRALN